ncbi:MAG: HlyD family efflux transporter periplasmic adaptor subunit [Bacteroidales bacterium]|nr:HlyD family efflux transporter periplasmic adaptor subunit [Bacteroidales bacterium]MBN2817851.1 HlyD family efflux transporter periplasmic adaptor subunit [Bacteroidales bacterium]
MKLFSVLFKCIVFLFIVSCKPGKDKATLYTVQKADFENRITVTGYLEASVSANISCPRFNSDATIIFLVPEGSYVESGDTVCILEVQEVVNKYNNSLKELKSSQIEYTKTVEYLNLQYLLLQSQVKTIETTAAISNLDSIQKHFVSASEKKIIELEIQKAQIQKQSVLDKLVFLKEINESELVKMKLKIEQAKNNVKRSEALLEKLVITTDFDGIVQYATNRSTQKKMAEGDIVWDRMPIITIPNLNTLEANLIVDEVSFKRMAKDQKLDIQVDLKPELKLTGTITRKSPVGKPVKRNSPVKFYNVYASVDSVVDLTPGLSITCSVLTESYSDTLVVPITAIFENDSSKYVFLQKGRKLKKQEIVSNRHSNTEAVIESGLEANDVISIIQP